MYIQLDLTTPLHVSGSIKKMYILCIFLNLINYLVPNLTPDILAIPTRPTKSINPLVSKTYTYTLPSYILQQWASTSTITILRNSCLFIEIK